MVEWHIFQKTNTSWMALPKKTIRQIAEAIPALNAFAHGERSCGSHHGSHGNFRLIDMDDESYKDDNTEGKNGTREIPWPDTALCPIKKLPPLR